MSTCCCTGNPARASRALERRQSAACMPSASCTTRLFSSSVHLRALPDATTAPPLTRRPPADAHGAHAQAGGQARMAMEKRSANGHRVKEDCADELRDVIGIILADHKPLGRRAPVLQIACATDTPRAENCSRDRPQPNGKTFDWYMTSPELVKHVSSVELFKVCPCAVSTASARSNLPLANTALRTAASVQVG